MSMKWYHIFNYFDLSGDTRRQIEDRGYYMRFGVISAMIRCFEEDIEWLESLGCVVEER